MNGLSKYPGSQLYYEALERDEMASMTDVMKALDMKPGEFAPQWKALTDKDKADLKQWLDDETR